ncbi:MAG: hypothetical protein ACOC8X_09590 [Chloroflexota bacterium]
MTTPTATRDVDLQPLQMTLSCPACDQTISNPGAYANHIRACYGGDYDEEPDGYLVRNGERVAALTVTVVYEDGRAIVYGGD